MFSQRPQGMLAFLIVWFGQLVSLTGTAMTSFALTIWAWDITGSATTLALVGFFSFTPIVVFSPLAGALVDRWNRKLVMILSDLGSGLVTIGLFVLYQLGALEIWHLYIAGTITGIFQAFQWPAYSASITLMVPKSQYGRASGMMSLADYGSSILAPVVAGALIVTIGLAGILTIDIITFIIAVLTLSFAVIPEPQKSSEEGRGNLWSESLYGFRYILQRRSLLGLQLMFFAGNFIYVIGQTVRNPMILARTGSDPAVLAIVQSFAAAGGVLGAVAMTVTGGPKPRINGFIIGWVVTGIGFVLMGLGSSALTWAAAAIIAYGFGPIINGSNQAIWQSKVSPDVQGRVFSVRRLIAQITAPLGMLVAGPLADRVFEPVFQQPGMFFGGEVGSGMAVLIILSGALTGLIGLIGYAVPYIRNVEVLLPDHQQTSET